MVARANEQYRKMISVHFSTVLLFLLNFAQTDTLRVISGARARLTEPCRRCGAGRLNDGRGRGDAEPGDRTTAEVRGGEEPGGRTMEEVRGGKEPGGDRRNSGNLYGT